MNIYVNNFNKLYIYTYILGRPIQKQIHVYMYRDAYRIPERLKFFLSDFLAYMEN